MSIAPNASFIQCMCSDFIGISIFDQVTNTLNIAGAVFPPRQTASRIYFGCWWLLCIVIIATYAGNLVAFMSVYRPRNPVDTLQELLQHPEYGIGISEGGSTEDFIKVKSMVKGTTIVMMQNMALSTIRSCDLPAFSQPPHTDQ